MKIPSDNRWTQTNQGDILGIINSSTNINLETPGKVILAKKSAMIHSDNASAYSGDVDFDSVVAIKYFNGYYNAITTDEAFRFKTNGSVMTQISSSDLAFSHDSDAEVWLSRLYATAPTEFGYYNGSTWTTGLGSLSSGNPHPIAIFDSLTSYKLAIGDGSTVKLYNSSHSNSSTNLTLPSQYEVYCLAYRSGFLYVGTRNTAGNEARVFVWDGNTANANYDIPVGADWVYSLVPYKQSVVAATSKGELLQIAGNSSVQLAAFPIYFDKTAVWEDSHSSSVYQIQRNGMCAVGESIYINISGDVDLGEVPEMRSGIWVYNPQTGLTHLASLSTDQIVVDTSLSLTSNVITTSADHNLITGDAVLFRSKDGISGLDADKKYFAYVTDTNKLKLAASRQSLANGIYLELTGTPTASDQLVYCPNTEWGQGNGITPGAISPLVNLETALQTWASPVIFCAKTETPSGTTRHGIYLLTDSYNVGQITTQRIFAGSLKDVWQRVTAFLSGLSLTDEKAILKYKTSSLYPREKRDLRCTWTDASTLSSTLTDADAGSDIEVGDEVVLKYGPGRGRSAHASSVTRTTTTLTIGLDEAIGSTSGTVFVQIDKFKKLGSFDYQREEPDIITSLVGAKSSWVQLKIELRGFQPELSHFELETESYE